MTPDPGRVLAVVGPTASGKSALAVAVAQRLQASGASVEIVGTDSMQVYRGMDIGTATPTSEEQGGIRHHLLDVWEPAHAVTVAEFQQRAREAIDDVRSRDARVIVVGGSGLYVSAVLDDLRFPGTDPDVRARLEGDLADVGAPAMHDRLAAVDPAAAAEILPTNGRRIVRALEVIEITGEPFVARLPDPVEVHPAVRVGLEVPRDELDARIAMRVDRMWNAGFVDEVRVLAEQGLATTPTAARALGYQQVLALLAGECTEQQARQDTIDATRRFARRQQRWFRRDPRITWLPYDSPSLVDDALALWAGGTAT
jgi:tRNA dimethylallyltransferase